MAALSMSACLDEEYRLRQIVVIPPRAFTRGFKATLVDVGVAISSAFTWLNRLVLPTLSQDDITAIASGRHQMDAFVRRYIHENLRYRFAMLPDGTVAYTVETAIKNGKWEHGRPFLNPGR
jgi:hypothetical protein